jgi:hypothetical protein
MSEQRGKCKCGNELITIKVNWLIFIAGLLVGTYLIGVPIGRADAVERMEKAAPYYYKETNESEG